MRNKYLYRSRISEAKLRVVIKLFSVDLNAIQISELSHLSRNSINKILNGLRIRIAELFELETPFKGEIEVDESFFGAKRKKGKRGRGAYGKVIAFGVYKRNGKVYTEIIPNCSKATLQGIDIRKVDVDSIIFL